MFQWAFEQTSTLMRTGGIVMWPLLLLCLIALTLVIERSWFFLWTNRPAQRRRVQDVARLLRAGQVKQASELVQHDRGIYADAVRRLLREPVNDALATEIVEIERRRLERFMPTMSTIITAAPMLGILGTVLGIIASFEVLSDTAASADPRAVGAGIAAALLTTAMGLFIAIGLLFPYNAFRAQVDSTLSRIESLAAAAVHVTNRSR